LVQIGKHVATAAKLYELAHELTAIHGEQRSRADLQEHANGSALLMRCSQSTNLSFEALRLSVGDCL
jgi:hypothetical protein